jgi:glycosyltransferase involved in cell wall biosynthesis
LLAWLASGNSIHTQRWLNSLAKTHQHIYLFTLHLPNSDFCFNKNITIIKLPIPAPFGYFFNAIYLKYLLKKYKIKLLHTHYASGYGTLARLSNFQPTLLSVWGSDVFDFPHISAWHNKLLQKNLAHAQELCSTSLIMAKNTQKFCHNKKINITPFGIDINLFSPSKIIKNNIINIGTVKTLAPKYGIDTLIQAFSLAYNILKNNYNIKLKIAGTGKQKKYLKNLVSDLKLEQNVEFSGYIQHSKVPEYLNNLDIYIAVSRQDSESFGVAVLEASACGLPVIVSRVGGLPEVVKENITGLIVEKNNSEQLAQAIVKLVKNQQLRKKLGLAGRQYVIDNYEWQKCVDIQQQIYKKYVI